MSQDFSDFFIAKLETRKQWDKALKSPKKNDY